MLQRSSFQEEAFIGSWFTVRQSTMRAGMHGGCACLSAKKSTAQSDLLNSDTAPPPATFFLQLGHTLLKLHGQLSTDLSSMSFCGGHFLSKP